MSQVTAIISRIFMNSDYNVMFYDQYDNLVQTIETATFVEVVGTYLICGDGEGNSCKFFANTVTLIEGPDFSQTYVPIPAGFYQQDQAYFNRLSEMYTYINTNVVNVVIRSIDALEFSDGTTQTTAATGGGGSGTVTSISFVEGTGIDITGTNPITTSGTVTITNSSPDQTVVLNNGTGINVTGTYPNFTIASTIDPSVFVPYTGATTNVDLGEYELKAGQIEFDQTPTGTAGVAVMSWNDADGTVDLGLKGGNVTLQIGQEQVTRVVNKTGSNLLESNYQVVKVDGAQGNRLKIALAQANNDANSAETLGMITENIDDNQEGFITTSGLVRNINTTGSLQGETWADGNMLYLSGTVAGQVTNIKPTAPIHTVIIGYVVRAHITQGQIYVKVDNGYELNELHDVAVGSYGSKDVLWRDTATNLWKNKDIFTLIGPASASTDGYLTSTDWTTFNSKGSGTVTSIATTSPILGGTITTSGTISIQQADTSKDGYLSATDWNTFKNKQDAISLTTSGASGPATLVGSTLNIPNYGSSGVSVYVKNLTTYSSTGTGSQIIHSLAIPANTFTTGDVLRVTARFKKVGVNSTSAASIYINNSVSLSGGKIIRSNPFAATTLSNGMQGTAVIINNVNLTQLPFTPSAASDIGLSTSAWIDSTAIDWTAIQYLLFSCAPNNVGDTVSLIYYQVEKL